ncbi:MAG: putative transcriptional regulatory protein [Candidatus Parcubacteria bacterium]|nr:MAG: putative transcriptional regulatory protein [Candidatus Parcubacteria bacterium]
MAGHSHWAQIKHKKAIVDAKRGQLISKLVRAISIAAREGSNPELNFKLRSAIERAKNFQVPIENIERAINKVSETSKLEEVFYEAYLDEVQLLIKTITDNKNRTLGEIKHLLNKYGGRLGEVGSVRWNFKEVGVIVVDDKDVDKILTDIDLINDFENKGSEGKTWLIVESKKINDVKNLLDSKKIPIYDIFLDFKPLNTVNIEDESKKNKINAFIEEALNLDEVDEVFVNI